MRITRAAVAERTTFLRELFRQTPTLTGPKAQTALKERFGQKMRPNVVYRVRTEVRQAMATTVPDTVQNQ